LQLSIEWGKYAIFDLNELLDYVTYSHAGQLVASKTLRRNQLIFYTDDDVGEMIDEVVDTLDGEALRVRLTEILERGAAGDHTCSVLMSTAPILQEVEAIVQSAARDRDNWCRSVNNPYRPFEAYFYTLDEDRVEIDEMIEEDRRSAEAEDLDSDDEFLEETDELIEDVSKKYFDSEILFGLREYFTL
jgi:hypothetical protein